MALVVLAVAMPSLVACAPADATRTTAPTAYLEQQLLDARDAGADASQIEVLEGALGRGQVTYADAEQLLAPFAECLEDSGLGLIRVDDDEPVPGFRVPGYSMALIDTSLGDDTGASLAQACETRFVRFVYAALYSSPEYAAAESELWHERRDQIEGCLQLGGVATDPGETVDELRQRVTDAILAGGPDCTPLA